jgi:catechol 2,3-dioxygenase-like lactoylglutathione lyase family enzyme
MKERVGEPWIPGAAYGRLLPAFTVNLLVRDVAASVRFYGEVLEAMVHYSDPDFAAVRVGGQEIMLHADHTYEHHPWQARLIAGERRGLGAEMRLIGFDPDAVERRAEAFDAVVVPTRAMGHAWREVMVSDPDGYVWAVGELIGEERGDAAGAAGDDA